MIPESQAKWQKQNMTTITAKLHNKYDHDIIEYMEKQLSKSDIIKKAIRHYMEYQEREKTEK